VTTNSDFLVDMLGRPDFVDGAATTAFIDENYPQGFRRPATDDREVVIAAALKLQIASKEALAASTLPDESLIGFNSAAPFASRLDLQAGEALFHVTALPTHQAWTISLGGERRYEVAVHHLMASEASVVCDGRRDDIVFHLGDDEVLTLAIGAQRLQFRPHRPWENAAARLGSGRVAAPMPGVVVALMATDGQRVEAGEKLAVLEAMKMQHVITTPVGGVVREVFVAVGRQLALGAPILDIEED
jgi:geranyl-CoA carboxylase alpha subunit